MSVSETPTYKQSGHVSVSGMIDMFEAKNVTSPKIVRNWHFLLLTLIDIGKLIIVA